MSRLRGALHHQSHEVTPILSTHPSSVVLSYRLVALHAGFHCARSWSRSPPPCCPSQDRRGHHQLCMHLAPTYLKQATGHAEHRSCTGFQAGRSASTTTNAGVLPGDVSAFSASKARYYAMYSEVLKPSHAGRTKELFKVRSMQRHVWPHTEWPLLVCRVPWCTQMPSIYVVCLASNTSTRVYGQP
jgi:hypothetical protein